MAFLEDLGNTAMGAATSLLDTAVFGGELAKAQIVPETTSKDSTTLGEPITLMFNPATVKWQSSPKWESTLDAGSDSSDKTFGGNEGRKVTLSNLIFDTFETRKNVRSAYIEKLEKLALRDHKAKHDPPTVYFMWGKFAEKIDDYNCPPMKLNNLDVEYTMFLNDGTPVRAKVSITLIECRSEEEQQKNHQGNSPDHAKIVTLRRGDTLQSVAHAEYDTPDEWRRIADANGIDDPMNVPPGTRLLVPPILR